MNSDKCHLLMAGHKFEQICGKIGTDLIWESNSDKLLEITIDNHLKFDKRISLLCANRKLSALAKISYYVTLHQKRTLIKVFFESQFRYCSLTLIFRSRKSNNKINLLHKRDLRMTYNDQISSFQELLDKDNSFTVHHFNIQSLAIEMFKVINNIAATIIDDLFTTYHSYNLRSKSKFVVPSVRTVHNGQNSIQYYQLRSLYLEYDARFIKDCETLHIFKGKTRKWKPINCSRRLYKKHISNLGSIIRFDSVF